MVVSRRMVEGRVPLNGIMEPVHEVDLISEAAGRVTSVRVNVGDAVSEGDTLAVIDDRVPESRFLQARAAVLTAENQVKIARITKDSDRLLLDSDDISHLEFEQSLHALRQAEAQRLLALAEKKLAQKQFEDTRITSPIGGLVSRRFVERGTMATQGAPLFRVVDLSQLKVNVGVPQAVAAGLKNGGRARVRPTVLNDVTLDGRVHSISPQADEETGAFTAEIRVPNTDGSLRAGLTATCEIILPGSLLLVVPDHAMVSREGEAYVYRVYGGKATLTRVEKADALGSDVRITGDWSKETPSSWRG